MVFSTHKRAPTITPCVEERLYPYLGGILLERRCVAVAINGVADHVHILTRYPPDLSHSDMLRHVKGRSSSWMGDTCPAWRGWQEGFGGFTVSTSLVPKIEAYIVGQKERHRAQSFEQEVEELHVIHGMEFVREDVFD
jgi:REP element-mobilizing transposase RayT